VHPCLAYGHIAKCSSGDSTVVSGRDVDVDVDGDWTQRGEVTRLERRGIESRRPSSYGEARDPSAALAVCCSAVAGAGDTYAGGSRWQMATRRPPAARAVLPPARAVLPVLVRAPLRMHRRPCLGTIWPTGSLAPRLSPALII
jgi:hypothetical protein